MEAKESSHFRPILNNALLNQHRRMSVHQTFQKATTELKLGRRRKLKLQQTHASTVECYLYVPITLILPVPNVFIIHAIFVLSTKEVTPDSSLFNLQ